MNRFVLLVVMLVATTHAQSFQRQADAESESLLSLSAKLGSLKCQAVIEYSGRCFRPSVIIAPPVVLNESFSRNQDVIGTLQQLLSRDKRFTVNANEDGIFTITQARVPQDFLNLRIGKVVLTEQQQYEPRDAMSAVFSTPEVRAYMKEHRITVANDWGGFVTGPGSGLPHLNPRIENTTVMDAVRLIVRTFPRYTHLAVYRECSTPDGRRVIAINFK